MTAAAARALNPTTIGDAAHLTGMHPRIRRGAFGRIAPRPGTLRTPLTLTSHGSGWATRFRGTSTANPHHRAADARIRGVGRRGVRTSPKSAGYGPLARSTIEGQRGCDRPSRPGPPGRFASLDRLRHLGDLETRRAVMAHRTSPCARARARDQLRCVPLRHRPPPHGPGQGRQAAPVEQLTRVDPSRPLPHRPRRRAERSRGVLGGLYRSARVRGHVLGAGAPARVPCTAG